MAFSKKYKAIFKKLNRNNVAWLRIEASRVELSRRREQDENENKLIIFI
jgi:hypothetical protein